MILVLLFYTYFLKIKCAQCPPNISDINLTPGIFFPGADPQYPQQQSVNQSVCMPNQLTPNTSTPLQQQQQQFMPLNNPYNQIPQNGYIPPSQMYYPNNQNRYTNQISTSNTQPPDGKSFANLCDNTSEREKFKGCISSTLKSLQSIIDNCRKTLGENAKECCINEECLATITNSKKGKRENSTDDRRDLEKDLFNRNDRRESSRYKEDTLDDFIDFLESKLDSKDSRDTRPNRNQNKRRYNDDPDNYNELSDRQKCELSKEKNRNYRGDYNYRDREDPRRRNYNDQPDYNNRRPKEKDRREDCYDYCNGNGSKYECY